MNDHDQRGSWGSGCAVVLLAAIVLTVCGGIVVVIGGTFYLTRVQVERARRAEMQARADAMMAQLEAMRQRDQKLPPGGHAIAIGPDGELFWDHQPIEMPRLKETLESLAPADERSSIPIHIRPGVGAPQDVIEQIRQIVEDYDVQMEPLPGPLLEIAPDPDAESQPPLPAK